MLGADVGGVGSRLMGTTSCLGRFGYIVLLASSLGLQMNTYNADSEGLPLIRSNPLSCG